MALLHQQLRLQQRDQLSAAQLGSSNNHGQHSYVVELLLKCIITFAAADKTAANILHSSGAFEGVRFRFSIGFSCHSAFNRLVVFVVTVYGCRSCSCPARL